MADPIRLSASQAPGVITIGQGSLGVKSAVITGSNPLLIGVRSKGDAAIAVDPDKPLEIRIEGIHFHEGQRIVINGVDPGHVFISDVTVHSDGESEPRPVFGERKE